MKKSTSQLTIVAGIVAVTALVATTMYILRPTAPVEKLEDRVERLEVITAKKTGCLSNGKYSGRC